jgi:hypothetical protein
MNRESCLVAVFSQAGQAEEARRWLTRWGFPSGKLDVIEGVPGRDPHSDGAVRSDGARKPTAPGKESARSVWGRLVDAVAFLLPGVGEKVAAEKSALSVLDHLDRWVDFAGHHARRRLLKFAGVPHEQCAHYSDLIWAGNSLVIALGSADEVTAAKDVLRLAEPGELNVYPGDVSMTDGFSEESIGQ